MLRQAGPGAGPAGSRVTLRIANVPSFLSEDDVARVFKGMGALSIRRAGGYMYAEFGDLMTAQKCKNAYDGWQGWGTPGLAIDFDGNAGVSYDPEYAKQQMSNQAAAPGVYGQQQAQQQQPGAVSRTQAAAPGSAPPGPAAATSAGATAGGPGASSGLAAALAGLSQSQLSSLAGLLGQAVGQPPAKPQAPIAQPQQPAPVPAPAPAAAAPAPVQPDAASQQAYNPASQLLGSLAGSGGLLSGLQGAGTQAAAGGTTAASQPLAAALQQLTANTQQQQLAANPLLSLLGLPGQAPAGQPNLASLLAALPAAAQLSALPQLQALLQLQSSAQPAAAAAAPAPAPAVTIVAQNPPGPTPPPGAPPPQARPGGPPAGPDGAPLPPNATATLFFNGLPLDMTKREAAHIFRPIQGYKDLRLLVRDHPHRPGERSTNLFVDFVDVHAATAAMHLLAGYKLDLDDDSSPAMEPKYGRPMPARAQAHADRTRMDAAPVYDGRAPAAADYRGGPPASAPAAGYGGVPGGYGGPAAYGGAAPAGPMTRAGQDHRPRTDDRGRDRERERDGRDNRERERDRDRRDQRSDENRGGRTRTRWNQ